MSILKKAKTTNDTLPYARMQHQLIEDYVPLVNSIARSIHKKLPAVIELDDLISSGIIGLIDAIEKFNPSRDNKFKTYAEWRIRGAIFDELRALDTLPRSARYNLRKIAAIARKIEAATGAKATHEAIAVGLGVDIDSYWQLVGRLDFRICALPDVDGNGGSYEFSGGKSVSDPYDIIERKAFKLTLDGYIDDLPDRERTMVQLCFIEGLSQREAAKLSSITESRVCQILKQGLKRLRLNLLRAKALECPSDIASAAIAC